MDVCSQIKVTRMTSSLACCFRALRMKSGFRNDCKEYENSAKHSDRRQNNFLLLQCRWSASSPWGRTNIGSKSSVVEQICCDTLFPMCRRSGFGLVSCAYGVRSRRQFFNIYFSSKFILSLCWHANGSKLLKIHSLFQLLFLPGSCRLPSDGQTNIISVQDSSRVLAATFHDTRQQKLVELPSCKIPAQHPFCSSKSDKRIIYRELHEDLTTCQLLFLTVTEGRVGHE